MPLVIDLGTNSAGTEPSPAIWDRVAMSDVFRGKFKHCYDDFLGFGDSYAVTSNVGRKYSGGQGVGGYLTYEDTGDTCLQIATDDAGVVAQVVAATNNNETWMAAGGAASVAFTPRTKANDGKSIFFEMRVKSSTLVGNLFGGLTEEGLAAADTMADSGGAMADKDFIGFNVSEATPTLVDFKYNKASAGGITTVAAGVHTLVADTFVKLGFIVDMEESDANKRIKIFVNGVEYTTYVTNTAYINTTLFPTGEELHFLFGGKNNNATKTNSIDWWRCAQLKTGN